MEESALRRWYARHHAIVWWAVALKLAFGLMFTLVVAPYRGPDEPKHVERLRTQTSALGYSSPNKWARIAPPVEMTQRSVSPGVEPDVRPMPEVRADDAPPRGDRPRFSDLFVRPPSLPPYFTSMNQHPPLYYTSVAGVSAVIAGLFPADYWSWDRQVWLYRLLSVLMCAALPLLGSSAALAVGLSRAQAAIAGAFMLLVPAETFIGSVANNDALLIPLAGIAVVASMRYLQGGPSRWAYVAAAAASAGALTKATAALLAPWVALVVVVEATRRWRAGARSEVTRAVAGVGAILVVGASWYLFNVARFSDPQPTVERTFLREDNPTSFGDFAVTWVDRISASFWARPLSRFADSGVASPVALVLTVAVVALVVVALFAARPWRRPTWLLFVLCAVQVAVLFDRNVRAYRRLTFVTAAQGRYLFTLIVPLAVLSALGIRRLLERRAQVAPATVAAWVAVVGVLLHAGQTVAMLDFFWAGDSIASRLDAVVAWSPWPSFVTLTMVAAPFVLAVAGAISLVRARATPGSKVTLAAAPGR
jgi:hypothetical protein